jgi:YD repeat-containing protein
VRNLSSGKVYWHLDSLDARQNITQYTLGNGVVTRRNYDPSFDFLTQIRSRNPKGVDVQNQSYTYNWVGNLTQRQDHVAGYTENFSYDALNRLVQAEIPGQTPLAMTYDVLGNITSKSDVGQYYYGENGAGPHVLTRLEFNNNEAGCLPSVLASYQYTSFDKLRSVAYGSDSLVLDYTMDHQRFQQRLYKNQTLARSKYYILGVLEREITASATRDRYFVKTPVGTVATLEYPDNGPAEVRYLMQDHLGSICALTNASGDLLQTLGIRRLGSPAPAQRHATRQPSMPPTTCMIAVLPATNTWTGLNL